MTEHSAATGAGDENPMAAFWLEAKKEWERRFYEARVEIGRTHRAVPDEFCLAPPDGGDVKPWEAVERMADALRAKDAEIERLREQVQFAMMDGFELAKDDARASYHPEIERLTKALREIIDTQSVAYDTFQAMIRHIKSLARAALKEQDQ